MEILQQIPVDVSIESILAQLHLSAETPDGKSLAALLETCRAKIRPKAVYRMCYIQRKHEDGIDLDHIRFTSRILRINVESIERVFPFLVTAGAELDEISSASPDLLTRYCLDVFKETVLRNAAAYVRRRLKQAYGLQKIAVMNPGSLEDWPITEQKALFSLLGEAPALIGVKLTDSYLMDPVKSVSGIIFPTEATFENCQLCPREDCPSRRAPYDAALLTTKYGTE